MRLCGGGTVGRALYRRAACTLASGALLAAGGGLSPAAALGSTATSVSGTEYGVTFAGTGNASVAWTDSYGEDGQLSGTWTVSDDHGADVWLPSKATSAAEGLLSSAITYRQASAVVPPAPTPAHLLETGEVQDPNTGTSLVPYTCTAQSVYDDGIATVTAGVILGHLVLGTSYGNVNGQPGRTFVAGHADPTQPNGVQFDGQMPCDETGPTSMGRFEYPYSFGSAADTIGYSASIPPSSVGQSTITAPANDASHITVSPSCDDIGTVCSPLRVWVTGTYTLQKICDGTLAYTTTTVTGSCGGAGPTPPDTKITKRTIKAKKRLASFAFKAIGAATGFECELLKKTKAGRWGPGSFKQCTSPKQLAHLPHGHYKFLVRAVNGGLVDPTPASAKFTV